MADNIKRVPYAEDPNRCQSNDSRGQCWNQAIPPSEYCPVHGANNAIAAAERASLTNYRLTKWNAQLQRMSTNPGIKSLRDEIGILRMIMEEKLNQCGTPAELMLQSGPLSDLVMKITAVVKSCHSLEGSMKQLLDKQAILQFAGTVITIITNHIEDEEVIGKIAKEIIASVEDLGHDDSE